MSTLCAGCGHDSVTAALVQAFWELPLATAPCREDERHRLLLEDDRVLHEAVHGFNSVHGRMPSVASGANAANRDLTYIGISGDGDSLSIGLRPALPRDPSQRADAVRHREQRRVWFDEGAILGLGRYRLDVEEGRGQLFNHPSTRCLLALTLGATFVARSFSGDKAQARPHPQGGIVAQWPRARRRHLALRDLQRPRRLDEELCVHAGALTSRQVMRISSPWSGKSRRTTPRARRSRSLCTMAARIVLRKCEEGYDPTNRSAAQVYIQERMKAGEYLTGLLFVEPSQNEFQYPQQHTR